MLLRPEVWGAVAPPLPVEASEAACGSEGELAGCLSQVPCVHPVPLPALQPILPEGASTLYSKIKRQKGVTGSSWGMGEPPTLAQTIQLPTPTITPACGSQGICAPPGGWMGSFGGGVDVISEGGDGRCLRKDGPWEVEPSGLRHLSKPGQCPGKRTDSPWSRDFRKAALWWQGD